MPDGMDKHDLKQVDAALKTVDAAERCIGISYPVQRCVREHCIEAPIELAMQVSCISDAWWTAKGRGGGRRGGARLGVGLGSEWGFAQGGRRRGGGVRDGEALG